MNNDSGILKNKVEIKGDINDLKDLFQSPVPSLNIKYIIIPCVLFIVTLFFIVIKFCVYGEKILTLLYLAGFGFITWSAASVQIRFKNIPTTTIVALGGVVLLLIACGLMTPKETLDVINKLKE